MCVPQDYRTVDTVPHIVLYWKGVRYVRYSLYEFSKRKIINVCCVCNVWVESRWVELSHIIIVVYQWFDFSSSRTVYNIVWCPRQLNFQKVGMGCWCPFIYFMMLKEREKREIHSSSIDNNRLLPQNASKCFNVVVMILDVVVIHWPSGHGWYWVREVPPVVVFFCPKPSLWQKKIVQYWAASVWPDNHWRNFGSCLHSSTICFGISIISLFTSKSPLQL